MNAHAKQSKFKVGDRVRIKDAGLFRQGVAQVGDSAVVTEVYGDAMYGVDVTTQSEGVIDQIANNDNLELAPQFAVGDRVQLAEITDDTDDPGTITGFDGKRYAVRWDHESTLYYVVYHSWYEGELRPLSASSEAATLRIEAGKFYKTRDGRKVGPMELFTPGCGALSRDASGRRAEFVARNLEDDGPGGAYTSGGEYLTGEVGYRLHIVAEWTDEPATTVAVAPATATPAKFKVGDRVTKEYWPDKDGYEVTRVNSKKVWLADTYGGDYPYDINDADLYVVLATSNPAIVALLDNGIPRPAHVPYVHDDTGAATKEAERLAGKHPGKEFGVYELVDRRKVERTYDHEWQRLAVAGKYGAAAVTLQKLTGMRHSDALVAAQGFAKAA